MQKFAEIFSKKLEAASIFAGVPVGCAIKEIFNTHQQLLNSAQHRQQMIQQKNAQIAAQSLQYRANLQNKIDLMQEKHKKNRQAQLTKIRKNQQHKIKCVQEIHLKHSETEKKNTRDRIKQLREKQLEMQNYWSQQKLQREKSQRTQSAAKPLYSQAFELKKQIESRNQDFGLKIRSQLVSKHKGRQNQICKLYQHKKEQVLLPHKSQIEKNLNKYKEIVANHQTQVVNNLGTRFASSSEVLKQKKKQWENKLKGRLIDEETNMQTIRSNLTERIRNRSASLASCKCKRINNVEEGLTKSIALTQKHRSSLFTDTLKNFKKNPSPVGYQRNQFLTRSQSLRSTVGNNKQVIQQKRYILQTERLQKQRDITAALELKKSIEVQGNCYIRLLNVK